ncbi:BrnT family toxin [uncultured Alsobacter sp.]|uniref:BrnT family toxin n=1 Tax=uncultured Alsobacter sp. TaxID=1748258 RepID=UPI0025DE6698|nr:BrnT family toxin [uncultured Alsobacter sp.]
MDFAGFDWDVGNSAKCRKHGLSLEAIESVFVGPVLVLPDRENPQERRFRAIGTTAGGRKAFIVFTLRERMGARLIRPISARYMHGTEVKAYEEAYPDFRDG